MNLAIFASGAGSNADRIMAYFTGHPQIKISLLVCNKAGAGALDVAAKHGVKSLIISKNQLNESDFLLSILQKEGIDVIVLAGFLLKIPAELVKAYPKSIINIHPALLPLYGGPGMYGQHVHKAVLANHETESGISIHYVDELYDHGELIFQARCPVLPQDTPESLAARIHELEHLHFAPVLEKALLNPR